MSSIAKKKANRYSFYLLGILFIFVVWHLGFLKFDNDIIIPSIKQTITSLKELFVDSYTYVVLGHTLLRLVISISFCLILGVLLACISKISYHFKAFVKPIFTILKTLPIAVLIILLLAMLSENSLYYIVGVVVLPLIYEATLSGLDSIDKNIIEEVKMDSKVTPYVISQIHLPLTLPYIYTSLLQSVGLGLKVLVMAEFISNATHSIGYEIFFYRDVENEMSYVYAWSIILIVFVVSVDWIISIVKKKSLV